MTDFVEASYALEVHCRRHGAGTPIPHKLVAALSAARDAYLDGLERE